MNPFSLVGLLRRGLFRTCDSKAEDNSLHSVKSGARQSRIGLQCGNANGSQWETLAASAGKTVDASPCKTFQLIHALASDGPTRNTARCAVLRRKMLMPKKSATAVKQGDSIASIQPWLHAGNADLGTAFGQADGDLAARGQLGRGVQYTALAVADDGVAALQRALRIE